MLLTHSGHAQYLFKEGNLPARISILNFSSIADAGEKELTVTQARSAQSGLQYHQLKGIYGNLGFTNHNYWLRFELVNTLDIPITYYLETAEPVTDNVDLYLFNPQDQMELQHSGDNLDYTSRVLPYRKTMFKIHLNSKEKKAAFINLKNDGEKNTLPLVLQSQEDLLTDIYHEQLLMGLFYGILLTIAVTYLFFFFALREVTFLYYSLYVLFTCLCHAALDGFFHQYIMQQNNWFNLHAVLFFAIGGSYFFGKYSEIVLEIKDRNNYIFYAFKGLYILFAFVLAGITGIPAFLKYAYPMVNIFTLFGMVLILLTIISQLIRKQKPDMFYVSGVSILFLCFTIVILLNFGFTYNSIFIDNITKIGIGLEITALSLSMANRIRQLKSKKEELQAVALQRAKEMNETKSHFLSNMSHELLTPLNAIIGLTHLMDSEITDPKLKANFELIKQASGSLVSSVNDILDFSKIEKGDLQLDQLSFSPAAILEQVKSRYAPQAEAKGLVFNFHCDLDPRILVMGDPIRLDQILNNVLNNAVKFTTRGTVSFTITASVNTTAKNQYVTDQHLTDQRVTDPNVIDTAVINQCKTNRWITAKSSAVHSISDPGNKNSSMADAFTNDAGAGKFNLVITIADTGEGIPAEKLDTVYQMFSQVEVDNKRRFGGFGIGLCVVKALVDLHHGDINLHSVLQQGTTCAIRLSYLLSEVVKEVKNVFPSDSYDLLNHHVLVVEDNPMNQMVLKMMFKKWKNTEVSFANDGAEGLEILAQKNINIVLMDLQMPVMDGYEAIAAIRGGAAGENRRNVPIIAITADLMQDTKDRVFELGVNDFLTKPVDQQLLYEKITLHLS